MPYWPVPTSYPSVFDLVIKRAQDLLPVDFVF